MEVVYRALTGTKLEKIFTSEEECKRYEYLNSIKMWDWAGDRTDDLQRLWFFFFLYEASSFFVSDGEMRYFLILRALLEDLLMSTAILFAHPDFIFMIWNIINSFLVGRFFLTRYVILLIRIRKRLVR